MISSGFTDEYSFSFKDNAQTFHNQTVTETMLCLIGIETCFLRLMLIFLLAGFHQNTSKSQTFLIGVLRSFVNFCNNWKLWKTKTLQTFNQELQSEKIIINLKILDISKLWNVVQILHFYIFQFKNHPSIICATVDRKQLTSHAQLVAFSRMTNTGIAGVGTSDTMTWVDCSTRVTIFGDSSRVGNECCADSTRVTFLPSDSTRVTISDSGIKPVSFLQNLQTSDSQTQLICPQEMSFFASLKYAE